jgi:thymidine kinase|tara:strand:- start:6 stop:512 length:507 start_codon:yes stop_codon:yes gene_type:complete
MFSGKTSNLIKIAKNCKKDNLNVIIINYIGDTRYSNSDQIMTHDGISMDCKTCGKDLIDILIKSSVLTADVICINEGQFFDNLVEFCNIYASLGKEIYVCGLDGDYLKRPFGEILDLIPHCDTVIRLSAECSCGKPANFTKKLRSTPELIHIGSHETYSPVCRKCYDN